MTSTTSCRPRRPHTPWRPAMAFALLALVLPPALSGCRSETSVESGGAGIPEGCPVRGETIQLQTTPGQLFLKDIRFFTAIGDSPLVTSPQGKVFAIVRFVWQPEAPIALPAPVAPKAPATAPVPPVAKNAPPSATPTPAAATPTPAAATPTPAAATPTPAAATPAPAAATPTPAAATPAPAATPAVPSTLPPPPAEIVPPPLQLVDHMGTPFPRDAEAMEAYLAMVDADPSALPSPTEFTVVFLVDPKAAEGGLFLTTPEKSADGTFIHFCLGRHKIEVEGE